ncbi:FAD-dependent monooxygenase [Micromonospora sp. WMMA1923]|uniref:FAD-dependent monooxygenase n=1 Tax=Micromonospora sp. WMMA1923 TaxID=3404125 RepID=UPI003B93B065
MSGPGPGGAATGRPRALVVGAGPAGLATAIGLRAAGFDPVVLEQAAGTGSVGTALTLWPNALAALAAIESDPAGGDPGGGIAAVVHALGQPAEGNQIRAADGRLLDDVPAPTMRSRFGGTGIALLRADLVGALQERLGADVVRTGARCVGWWATADRVTVRLADGTEESGDLLVGADGLRSVVRAQLCGGRDELSYAGYPVWRGVTDFDLGSAPGLLSMGRGAQFGLFPMTHGRAYWFASLPLPAGRGAHLPAREFLSDRFADWHRPVPQVLAATADWQIMVTDIYERRPVRRWGQGRVTLVGDAAHPSTPHLGQGTCQAFEDAAVLGLRLRQGRSVPEALRDYEAARRTRANALTRQARMLGQVGQWRHPAACWAREQMIRRSPRGPRLRQLARMFSFRQD